MSALAFGLIKQDNKDILISIAIAIGNVFAEIEAHEKLYNFTSLDGVLIEEAVKISVEFASKHSADITPDV